MNARKSILLNQESAKSSELITVFGRQTFDPVAHTQMALRGGLSLDSLHHDLKETHNEVATQIGKMLGFSYRDFISMAEAIEAFEGEIGSSEKLLKAYEA